jgi:hypothetical protein
VTREKKLELEALLRVIRIIRYDGGGPVNTYLRINGVFSA